MKGPVLEVSDLKVHFALPRKGFGHKRVVHAVDGVSFQVAQGKTLGIVGESGSGKTTVALSVMRLVSATAGSIKLNGSDFGALRGDALRVQRRHIQMVFQDPYSSLNPRSRAKDIVAEPLDLMQVGTPSERQERVTEVFRQVGLRADQLALFPHQFSGGQRQRLGIARALATKPDLVVCDEPVSALDVAIQAQILNLLAELQREYKLSYLFISHDLAVVQHLCDDVLVMYLGQVVEAASREQLFTNPLHPYTWALLSSVPQVGRRALAGTTVLDGDPPSPVDLPVGCRFAARCAYAQAICRQEPPPLRAIAPDHSVACHLVTESGDAPHRPALFSPR